MWNNQRDETQLAVAYWVLSACFLAVLEIIKRMRLLTHVYSMQPNQVVLDSKTKMFSGVTTLLN